MKRLNWVRFIKQYPQLFCDVMRCHVLEFVPLIGGKVQMRLVSRLFKRLIMASLCHEESTVEMLRGLTRKFDSYNSYRTEVLKRIKAQFEYRFTKVSLIIDALSGLGRYILHTRLYLEYFFENIDNQPKRIDSLIIRNDFHKHDPKIVTILKHYTFIRNLEINRFGPLLVSFFDEMHLRVRKLTLRFNIDDFKLIHDVKFADELILNVANHRNEVTEESLQNLNLFKNLSIKKLTISNQMYPKNHSFSMHDGFLAKKIVETKFVEDLILLLNWSTVRNFKEYICYIVSQTNAKRIKLQVWGVHSIRQRLGDLSCALQQNKSIKAIDIGVVSYDYEYDFEKGLRDLLKSNHQLRYFRLGFQTRMYLNPFGFNHSFHMNLKVIVEKAYEWGTIVDLFEFRLEDESECSVSDKVYEKSMGVLDEARKKYKIE